MNLSKKMSTGLFLAYMSLVAPQAFSSGDGECHFHGSKQAEELTVIKCSDVFKSRLINKGKLENSWQTIQHAKIELVDGKAGKKEWKLTFKDPAAKDKSKENLYMFFTGSGNFIAANFTGK